MKTINMLHWIIIALVVGAVVRWLLEEISSETSFTLDSTVARRVIYDFLKAPINLERTHPYIKKISNVEAENETVTFEMVEDLGLLGKNKFPVKLVGYSDASHFTSHIQIETSNSFADVKIVLDISDFDDKTSTNNELSTPSSKPSEMSPSVTVRGSTKVKTWRVLNFLISGHVSSVWENTTKNTIDLLGGQSDSRANDHEKSS